MEAIDILVVEDDAIIAKNIQHRLKSMGFSVSGIVASGEKAIVMAGEHEPDIILMDIVLKGEMNGIEAAKQIRDLYNIPVIYHTAYTDEKFISEAIKTEPFGYLTKPFEDKELKVAIQIALYKNKMAHELEESEKKYKALYDNAPLSYQSLDKNGYFLDVNPFWLKTLGYEREEVIGKRFSDFIHPDYLSVFKKKFPELQKLGSVSDVQFKIMHKKGHAVDISFEASVGYERDGSFRQTYAVFKDITQELAMQEKLLQSQKIESLGRLAGGIAHDYNNALSVITGFTELVLQELDSEGVLHEDLNEVLKAANRASGISKKLLAFARKQAVQPEVIDLNRTLEDMIRMLKSLIGENIGFNFLPHKELWLISMDISQIDQILVNLCINARDAINANGSISVETDNVNLDESYCEDHLGFIPGEFVLLTVSDTGCGMEKDIIENIFDPFFTTKDIDKGTGLGLATVFGIVKQNNGFINVYSEPGHGTCIKIYLPKHEGRLETREQTVSPVPNGYNETILIVEDNFSVLKLASKILRGLGYHVVSVSTPLAAVDLVQNSENPIHLLLTDVIMPEMNGKELVERLKTLCPELKYMYMSGYTADVIANNGILDKGVAFIQKPFSKSDLATIVRKTLDQA